MEKWHYDGHGINDEAGNRLLKAQVARLDPETQGINPDFDRISILAAAAPEMLEALRECVTDPGAHCFTADDNREAMYRRLRAINEIARALINHIEAHS